MRILHTEASQGWGGQEIRILKEAIAMRLMGHEVIFATHPDAKLKEKAKEERFTVYSIPFAMKCLPWCLFKLIQILYVEKIDLVNTHSSVDSWIGGIAGKLTGRKVIRTRHLSAKIKKGMNSKILYNWLANAVATTCQEVCLVIRDQAGLTETRCRSIPTGVDPSDVLVSPFDIKEFKKRYGIQDGDFVVGTVCVLRSWKGIVDLLSAAATLKDQTRIKWFVVGSGPRDQYYLDEAKRLGVEDIVTFTGHLDPPYAALASFDVFILLSTANEGVSQASLQAAYLSKPLITTPTGGLKEVTIENRTGYLVPINSPEIVAEKILSLKEDPSKCKLFGQNARQLVCDKFLFSKTIEDMLKLYNDASK